MRENIFVGRGVGVEIMRPLRGRHLGHAAEQPLGRTRAHQHHAVAAHQHEGRAAAEFSFALRCLDGKTLSVAAGTRGAGVHPGAEHASRLLRRAHGGTEIHQGLPNVSGVTNLIVKFILANIFWLVMPWVVFVWAGRELIGRSPRAVL